MTIRSCIQCGFGLSFLMMLAPNAGAVSIGGMDFNSDAFADTLLASSGNFWNYNSTGPSDHISGVQLESDITDISAGTWVAGDLGTESLDLRFGQTTVINGAGNDLAVFLVGDGTRIDVSLIDHSATSIRYFGVDTGYDVVLGSTSYKLEVALIDLDDFGLSAGELMGDLRLENFWFSVSMAASLGSTVTAVPVPAAAWLFGTGLLGLVGVARRRSAV